MKIEDILKNYDNKKIQLKYIQKYFDDYIYFVKLMESSVKSGILKPVKASGLNGRVPPLYNTYWIVKGGIEDEEELKKILLTLPPVLDNTYYLKNLEQFKKDIKAVNMLRDFFLNPDKVATLKFPYSMNERSFQIFHDEKFISNKGEKILKRLGLDSNKLNYYNTPEPFFYYYIPTDDVNNILIVENKDTFYTLKQIFNGERCKIGNNIYNMLIYGEGKKILSSINYLMEIETCKNKRNNIYYFGDMDYVGLGIFIELNKSHKDLNIKPDTYLYKCMIDECDVAPALKTHQAKIDIGNFIKFFDEATREKIVSILESGRYVPQEVLSYMFFHNNTKKESAI